MDLTHVRLELIEFGYPAEDFSDQKAYRIYPKAIVPFDAMYEDLIRREFPIHEMSKESIKRT